MGINEKLDYVISKVDCLVSKVDNMESKMDNMESRMDSMESRMDNMESRMDNMESKMEGMESTIKNLDDKVESYHDDLKKDIARIDLKLENEIARDIRIIAEGHLDLSRTLHESIKKNAEYEMLSIRVSGLESKVAKLERKHKPKKQKTQS